MAKILIIGMGYIGMALAENDARFAIVSHDTFEHTRLDTYEAVVNAAAIAGQTKCEAVDYGEVRKANVDFPIYVEKRCFHQGLKCIQFSTVAVYERKSVPMADVKENRGNYEKQSEESPVFAHNAYICSKLEMELSLTSSYILRIGYFKPSLLARIKNYKYVQDTWCSILTTTDLKQAILDITDYDIPQHVYNLKSHDVYLPDFVASHYKPLPIRYETEAGMSPAIPISNAKYDMYCNWAKAESHREESE